MNTYDGRFDSSVEIGHIYVPETSTPFTGDWRKEDDSNFEFPVFEPQTEYLQNIEKIAQTFSTNPILLTLVDDIGKTSSDTLITECSILDTLVVEDVYRESEYTELAKELVGMLQGKKLTGEYRISEDGRKAIMGSGKSKTRIPLVGFRGIEDPEFPSCTMHDLAWTLDRLESVAPRGSNILPVSFSEQQKQVSVLGRVVLGPHFEFTSIFVDESGQEASRYRWPLDD